MPVHGRTRRRSALRLLGAAALVLPAALTAAAPASAASAAVNTTALTLTMPDGTGLTAELTQPGTSGPHPAIVFIDSWATPDFEYLVQARQFAADGYIVLEYDPRGFYSSGGTINVAGPQDVADVSSVISWLVANTSANPAEIGVGGISYGAGLSLLAAGHDARIRAVAAMSAWTDLDYSLYPNSTRHQESTDLLAASAEITGKPSPDFQTVLNDFYSDTNVPEVLSWGAVRSPQTYVNSINTNGPAVFIANGLQDSIFAPNQLLPFYDDLSTPKYLMLQPGDHATSEASGLLGLDNPVWDRAHAWFDHYLTGAANGINTQPPVQVEPIGGSSYQGYASPESMTTSSTTYQLGAENWLGTGSMGASAASFSTKTSVGTASCAAGGTLEVSGVLTQFFDSPPTCWLPAIDRSDDAVWQSAVLPATDHLRGTASLNLTVKPSASSGTLYAYLYDVNLLDDGTLISYLPYTYTGATPGMPLHISAQFLTTSYDIPAGDSVALVIGTKDPLFLDADQPGSTVTFTGPSSLTLPLGS